MIRFGPYTEQDRAAMRRFQHMLRPVSALSLIPAMIAATTMPADENLCLRCLNITFYGSMVSAASLVVVGPGSLHFKADILTVVILTTEIARVVFCAVFEYLR